MDPSRAALLAVATLLGLLVLAQSDGARASAISLRPLRPNVSADPRCAPTAVHAEPQQQGAK
jgi:hypothetical protein